MSKTDDVGYRKPPRKNQFKPGQSGNPKGRPKGTRNLKTDLKEELEERISIRENGLSHPHSKQRILLKALVAKGMKGDVRAIQLVFNLIAQLFADEHTPTEEAPLDPLEEAILDDFEARLLRRHEVKNEETTNE